MLIARFDQSVFLVQNLSGELIFTSEFKIPRFRFTGMGSMILVSNILTSMSVLLLVIKVHILRIISLSIARKQKKYDRITDISNARGIKSASLEDVKASDDTMLCEFEVLFGSAEQWLSDKWVKNLKSGYLNETEVLVVDEVHTIQTW